MTILEFILLLIVAGICGAIGQAIAGYSAGGCLASIAVGFIGALLGYWLAGILGLPAIFAIQFGAQPFPIVWSIMGSALFVAVISLFARRRYY
ncbi:MAG: GlsB/YeaQ/YmgE family stress response membrane protein [Acidobacteriota bacterium]